MTTEQVKEDEQFFEATVISIKNKVYPSGDEYLGVTARVSEDSLVWFSRPLEDAARNRGLVVVELGDRIFGTAIVSGHGDEPEEGQASMTFLKNVNLEGDPAQSNVPSAGCTDVSGEAIRKLFGTYTVRMGNEEDHRTVKFDHVKDDKGSPFAGWVFVKFLMGHDNEADYITFGYVKAGEAFLRTKKGHDMESAVGKAVRALAAASDDERHVMGVEYAKQSGNCYVCGRKLTVPASIDSGIGPVCASKYGAPYEENVVYTSPQCDCLREGCTGCDDEREDEREREMEEEKYEAQHDDVVAERDRQDKVAWVNRMWTKVSRLCYVVEASDIQARILEGPFMCPGCGRPIKDLMPKTSKVNYDNEGEMVSHEVKHECGALLITHND